MICGIPTQPFVQFPKYERLNIYPLQIAKTLISERGEQVDFYRALVAFPVEVLSVGKTFGTKCFSRKSRKTIVENGVIFPRFSGRRNFVGNFHCLPFVHAGNESENRGFPFSSQAAIRSNFVCPPLQLPNWITRTAFSNTSFLESSAGQFLPASYWIGLPLLFRDWKYIHAQTHRELRNVFCFCNWPHDFCVFFQR